MKPKKHLTRITSKMNCCVAVKKGLERLIKKKEVRIRYVPDIEGEDLFGLISRVDRAIKQY